MSKEIYISSTPHETRLAIVENDELTEIYYERENEYTLAGSIYNGKVTRVLPGMQSSFVDVGLERDAFLYITDFMEEAGDSADFDHGEKPQRAPRSDSQRGDRSGSDRNGNDRGNEMERGSERNAGYISERNQEQARATPQSDVAQASEGRTEEFGGRGERNDRGGRGRGRGRRDRGADTGGPTQDRGAAGSRQPLGDTPSRFGGGSGEEPVPEEEAIFASVPEVEPLPVSAVAPEIGEGAPGADGSRRWRGRRGRRRGRGPGQREAGAPPVGEPATGDDAPVSANASVAHGHEFDEEPVFEIDGSAAEVAPMVTPMPEARQQASQQRPEPSGRSAEPAREGRGGRGGRGDRPQREDRNGGGNDRAPRAPRGFAPTRSLYGVDAEPEVIEAAEEIAVVEPLILPGESLGKYRKGGDEAGQQVEAAASQTTPVTLPDTAFKVDPNWDGGAMLPGETLSRYRGGAPSAPPGRGAERPEGQRGEGRRDGRQDESREGRSGRGRSESGGRRERGSEQRQSASQGGERTARPMMVPSSVQRADRQSAGPMSGYAHVDEKTGEIQAHRPDFSHAELPEATAEARQPESAEPTVFETIDAAQAATVPVHAQGAEAATKQHGTDEYEPEEASASYRVDPAAPSEYRQSAPAMFEDAPGVQEQALPPQELTVAPSGELFAAGNEHGSDTVILDSVHAGQASHEKDRDRKETIAEPTHSSEAVVNAPAGDDATGMHDVTRMDAAGTMVSEPDLPAAALPEETVSTISLPVEDDHATAEFEDEAAEDSSAQQSFAPGAGDLEEDFIEEEEFETASLHAHGGEEFDDAEEEPLEGAADLGTMIRDMSLDHMTSSRSDLDGDDEDFEEDTLEEEMQSEAEDSLEEDDAEEHPRANGFASAATERGEEDGEDFDSKIGLGTRAEGSQGFVGETSRGDSTSASDSERRGRRDGRRSGRGDRDRGRGGSSDRGAAAGDRGAGSDRSGSSDRNGSTDRNGSSGFSDRSGYDRGGLGERARNTGGGGDRDRGRSSGRGGRQSMQTTNLPAISELLKPGQEILCQIAKEPIAKKGARITSHIALPGRFLVFMPTVSHTGVSRKIESDAERRRLKEILLSEKGDAAGGFIVRTAAGGASEDELRSDLRFLLNLWTDIKQRSESSKSPALIYHDLNLVERILRDQVTDNFSAIWVDTETEYERVLRFLQRFQPGLIRRVKLYTKETPLFEQFGITEEINKALRSKVWLKSGGSIVINQTEALVAIDINTGKYVGKTARLEDTIVKTNLDAIPEIVRQIRLRDLGGIIIIDFIDMDERKNRNRVMAALEEELKNDRAPSKVLPFNDFGLVAITRKRVKQSLERTLSTPCNVCVGTGMVKSPVTVCNDIYVEMRKMHKHLDRGDVMLRVHPEVVKQLKLTGSRWLQEMEEMCGKTILIKSDPALHPEQFDIH